MSDPGASETDTTGTRPRRGRLRPRAARRRSRRASGRDDHVRRGAGRGRDLDPGRGLLGRTHHAGAPSRRRRALRPRRSPPGGSASARSRSLHRRCRRSSWRSIPTTTTTPPAMTTARKSTRRRSRCATAGPRCCVTATSRDYSHDEFAESRRLMDDLRMAGSMRRSRRLRASRRDRGRPDLRRTVRRAIRAGGEPISRAYVEPAERPRRLVLLCDVSGSMEAYARGLVALPARRGRRAGAGWRRSPSAPDSPASPASSRVAIPTPPSPRPPSA